MSNIDEYGWDRGIDADTKPTGYVPGGYHPDMPENMTADEIELMGRLRERGLTMGDVALNIEVRRADPTRRRG